jgi:hypothetical protein
MSRRRRRDKELWSKGGWLPSSCTSLFFVSRGKNN